MSVGIFYCTNSTDNNNWCKTKDDIEVWLSNANNYFAYQETRVKSSVWEDSPSVQQFPYNGD